MWVTSVELQYAYTCGYTSIYLIKAIVSANVGKPFEKYINEHYNQRCEAKRLRDQHPEGSAEWAKYEALQGIAKNAMNSLYGKMAASQTREISKELTTNSTLILNMAKTGLLE